jgi:hypothetical protein
MFPMLHSESAICTFHPPSTRRASPFRFAIPFRNAIRHPQTLHFTILDSPFFILAFSFSCTVACVQIENETFFIE